MEGVAWGKSSVQGGIPLKGAETPQKLLAIEKAIRFHY